MRTKDIVKKIEEWQGNPKVHPLTCGNDSHHRPLHAQVRNDTEVVLVCDDCDYEQSYIPDAVLR